MLERAKELLVRWARGRNAKDVPTSKPPEQATDVPVRRWTQDELDAKLQELERLPADEWTATDHYSIIEYVVQQYHPRSEPLWQSKWDASMAKIRRRVDENMQALANGTLSPSDFEETNRQLREFREQLYQSYDMPLADFQRIVMPALQRYPFAEGLSLSAADTERLWNASASVSLDGPLAARHARSDSRDQLLGRVGYAILEAAEVLRGTYEMLRRARNAGCTEVALVVPERCGCVYDLLDGRVFPVADLLQSYEDGAPLMPPPRTPCTVSEAPVLCRRLAFLPIEPSVPGVDADFAATLEQILSTPRPPLDAAWEARLEERVIQRLASAD